MLKFTYNTVTRTCRPRYK